MKNQWHDSQILKMVVARCHVGDSHRRVAEYFVSRLKEGYWETIPQIDKIQILRAIISAHQSNIRLFNFVMKGG